MSYVEENGPRFNMFTFNFNVMEIDGVKEEW